MIYTDFKGKKLSSLGFGAMRFPVLDGKDSQIDETPSIALIEKSIELGINYFDTGWDYHKGKSEPFLAKALAKYPRESYYIADKFPGYNLLLFPEVDSIFEKQLVRLNVDYFDFYLLHNLCELNVDAYLDPKFHVRESMSARLESGQIKHLGVSSHAQPECLLKFLESYGDIVEFCQIQLNVMDWDFQRAKETVKILNDYNIPIWVMEPLRGGTIMDIASVEEAFDFVRSIDGVSVTLSGMSTMDQLIENAEIFSRKPTLSEDDFNALVKRAADKVAKGAIPCTACKYCVHNCPMGLDIPYLLSLSNQFYLTKDDFIAPMALGALKEDKQPWACIACGACEKVCPQKLKISDLLSKFSADVKEKI